LKQIKNTAKALMSQQVNETKVMPRENNKTVAILLVS